METPEVLYFETAPQWRAWLERHHKTATEAWLLHVKKNSKKAGLRYEDALDEALAYGWIDTKLKSVDKDSFKLRYVPRKPGSIWSKQNRDRAEELTRQGRMTAAGLAPIEEARRNGKWDAAYTFLKPYEIPDDLKRALSENPAALKRFEAFANSPRNMYIYWVNSAKTQSTRDKRITEVVSRSADNLKPGQV